MVRIFGKKHLIKQAISFIDLSGIGWILDFCTYTVLGFFSKNLVLNNMISSGVGVTFVFIFATQKVFQNNSRISLKWKYLIYVLYQVILIYLVSKTLSGIHMLIVSHISLRLILEFSSMIAKILVTPFTMVLNFFVMKGIIEKL